MIEFISAPFAMVITILILPSWIRLVYKKGLVSKDMHKSNTKVADLGGLCILAGFLGGLLGFVGYHIFGQGILEHVDILFAGVCSVLIAAMIGFADDTLGWKIGLRQWHRVVLSLLAALPMVALNVGEATMNFPLFGEVYLGLLFPLVMIPLAIVGASNGFNMIAGFNGLESGMGILILSTLGWLSYVRGYSTAAVLAFAMVGALISFLIYNWYPAQIFPGNTMTYAVGALIGIVAILGNIEKFGFILFIPYFIECVLKSKGFMQKESFGKLQAGYLRNRYKKWYGLEHVAISLWYRATEQKVVLSLLAFEGVFILIALSIFY